MSIDKTGKITVLSDEPYNPYFKPMLPFIISGKKSFSNITITVNKKNITIKLNSKVTSVNTKTQKVIINNFEEINYDKILFATGSSPYIPQNIKGIKASGVFALKKLSDTQSITKRLTFTNNAVMIGGGLANLKVASELIKKNIKVTFITSSSEILSQIMEPQDTFLIKNALKKTGIKFLTNSEPQEILSDKNGVKKIILNNGNEINCEAVFIGKGIIANTKFLTNSGIKTDKQIVVNQYTKCSAPNTYAAGDGAVAINPYSKEKYASGLWTLAIEMGATAGLNMAGIKKEYKADTGVLNAVNLANIPIISIGKAQTNKNQHKTYIKSGSNFYRKIIFTQDEKKVKGALFIGDIKNAGLYRYIIREKIDIQKVKKQIIENSLNYGYFLNR